MGTPAVESNGRPEQTEVLYREHGAAVAALCRSLLRDRAEAEDAAQQVFLSAHRALLNGTAPREPLAWLLAAARNECYARFRQRSVNPTPTGEAPDGATADASVHALRAGELASVWEEVRRMPPTQRKAFLLREIRGLSYGQLAAELSLSPPSVRSLLLRARTRLRHRLGDVAAAVGGAPWLQTLFRLVAGGDGASPVPAATKAVAVGLGALALAGAGDAPRAVHHPSATPRHAVARHPAETHVRSVAAPVAGAPVAVAVVQREDRSRFDRRGSEHASRHDDGSSGSGSDGSGSREGGDDGAGVTVATAPVAQPTTSGDGHDGGGGGSTGSTGGSEGPTTAATTTTVTTVAEPSSGDGGDGDHVGTDSGSTDGGHDGGGGDGS